MKRGRKNNLLFTLLVTFLLISTSLAHGVPITVQLTGSVTDWDGSLGTQFSVGDALFATYTYDSNAVDTSPIVSYGYYALNDFSGALGSYAFSSFDGSYHLLNSTPTFGDQIFVYGTPYGTAIGVNVGDAVLAGPVAYFRDFDGVFLSDDSLITVAPDLSVMEQQGFALAFDSPTQGRILVRANIETSELAPIPEPSTMLLLSSGLLGVIALRKKIKKN